jgi:septal ring factor EnvC (AmiA/AmiB activator)
MDATLSSGATAPVQQPTTKDYKSRPGALIWFFRKSRDLWKSKYQALKASVKRLKNHVADLTKSREQWRLKAERAHDQLRALEAEIADLRARVEALSREKKATQVSAH